MYQRPASAFEIQITFQKRKIINSAGPKNIQHKAFFTSLNEMHLNVILNSSQNDQHLFVWKYLCKPSSSSPSPSSSSPSSSSSSSSYSSSNLTEAQIDPNPFHSLMSAIGLRRKLCKRNSEQVIDSYYSPNKHQKLRLKSVCGILFTEYPGFCFVLFKGSCINQQRFPWP